MRCGCPLLAGIGNSTERIPLVALLLVVRQAVSHLCCCCVFAACCRVFSLLRVAPFLVPLMSSSAPPLHTCGVDSDSSFTSSPYPMLPVSEALSIVLSHCRPLPAHGAAVWSAGSIASDVAGAVLSADVLSVAPFPPFRASTMDGYAVHSSDGAGVYPVTQRITAGSAANLPLPAGQVAYITTGAPLPPQADAVIMVERTNTTTDNTVTRTTTQTSAQHSSPLHGWPISSVARYAQCVCVELLCGAVRYAVLAVLRCQVRLLDSVAPGTNVRPIGCDIAEGEGVSHSRPAQRTQLASPTPPPV